MELSGTICAGEGRASRTLKQQRKQFAKRYLPMVDELHPGTINIDISPQRFTVKYYDYYYQDVSFNFWRRKKEDFGLI